MKREISNIAASIQAKLQNKAHESGQPFNELLQYYGMERFLYRLSKTPHVNDLILKGGLMFYGLGIPMRRTTRDIDFLGISENAQRDILLVFREALSIPSLEDGIFFDVKSLRLSQTQMGTEQGGVRITFVGNLGKMRLPIQVDVGFSDELASEVLDMEYPVLLPDMEKPHLKGYPPESIISEKFYAMIHFADANSRWKDYYDIFLLTETFEFGSHSVANAIRSTFDNRPAEIQNQIPPGLRESFAISKQQEWEAFLRKSKSSNDLIKDLMAVVNRIWQFLEYPLQEIQTGQHTQMKKWGQDKKWR
ncbi:MAG: nucleotidyl transferase AbiEii/AbiGii toxin family protein [Anaerolineales bacterium]|nr:nucleotidyl transferase AbiEii/AbiGii toxin family protein [Anaerolineales bacterium]